MSYSWLALFQGITGRGFYPTDAVWQFNLRENCWKCEIMMNQWKNKSYITYSFILNLLFSYQDILGDN